MNFTSSFLRKRHFQGLLKLGDLIIPGSDELPSFSASGAAGEIDRILKFIPPEDRQGLVTLLFIISFLPNFMVRGILLWAQSQAEKNMPWSTLGRTLSVGLRGPIFTLYYSDIGSKQGEIFRALSWDAKVNRPPKQELYMGPEQIMATARSAARGISQSDLKDRLKVVKRLREIIIMEQDEIIKRIQLETKKSKSDALISEIFSTLDSLHFLEHFAPKALCDQSVPTPLALLGKKSFIQYAPCGVVLIICPWNYPFYQAIVPTINAFVAGNSVVYKPSPLTPLKGLVENLLIKAGITEGQIQIAYGDGSLGEQLIEAGPDKIFFIGGLDTGKKIAAQAAKKLIPVELELGGKDPMVVFNDVCLKRAVSGALWGSFTNTGQSCTSIEEIYIQEDLYSQFKTEFLKACSQLTQGVDDDGNCDFGLMTSQEGVTKIKALLDDALKLGATQLSGQQWNGSDPKIPPIVLENVAAESMINITETFGPVVTLWKFQDEDDLIDHLNKKRFGLSASVWSKNKARAISFAKRLETGNVSINNVMLTEANPHLPFGGVKDSGIGHYKGISGLRTFTRQKSMIVDSDGPKIEANWYPYTPKRYQIFKSMMNALFSGGILNFFKFALNGISLENYAKKATRAPKGDHGN